VDLVQSFASDDFVLLVRIERQHGEVGGLPDQDWSLRVTMLFRREGGDRAWCTGTPTRYCARSTPPRGRTRTWRPSSCRRVARRHPRPAASTSAEETTGTSRPGRFQTSHDLGLSVVELGNRPGQVGSGQDDVLAAVLLLEANVRQPSRVERH
jgi:hypothetical protein